MLSCFSCVQLCVTVYYSLSGFSVHGFFRQEYRSGLPIPSLGDLPNPGIKPVSPALQADSLPSKLPGKPLKEDRYIKIFQNMIEWTSHSVI